MPSPTPSIDPRSGYNPTTKTFHSLRPSVPLPPLSTPLSLPSFVFSLLLSPLPSRPSFILHSTSSTSTSLSFPSFLSSVNSLSSFLYKRLEADNESELYSCAKESAVHSSKNSLSLSKSSVALIISPPSLHIPVLYFALLSIGVIVSPINPLSSPSEISHYIRLSNPSVIFATSSTAALLPSHLPVILLDSPLFSSLLTSNSNSPLPKVEVSQSDPAAILYSSGTTGKFKGVTLTHRNLISLIASYYFSKQQMLATLSAEPDPTVALFTIPLFHSFGFTILFRSVTLGDTTVLMERFDFVEMLKAVERYRVTSLPVSPPLMVAMIKSDEALRRDLSSLKVVGCGGAPLGRDVAERFKARFPNIQIVQGYGLTETTGGIAGTATPEESEVYGSTGRLGANVEAKIVDLETGEAVGPGVRGELWLRGPTVMKGYVGDSEATSLALDSEGWLKTGDLCYINEDGFLFIVDRIKELIKYKGYQVAPAELENLLHSHPEIEDAAVVPYPDEEAGEIPMAFVVRRPGSSITEEQVMDFVAKQVVPYKKIRGVAFVSSIPKTQAGKILRRELRNHALSLSKSKL